MYIPASPVEDAFLIFPSWRETQSFWKEVSPYLLEQFFAQVKGGAGADLKTHIVIFVAYARKHWPGIVNAQLCMELS